MSDEFISVWEVTREYGGPEEGGWWYNTGHCVAVVAVAEEHSASITEAIDKFREDNKSGDIYSVLGGVEYQTRHHDTHWDVPKVGAFFPEERPHYE